MFRRWLILTTTTSFFARHIPGSQADVPLSKPPPCNQNITGFLAFRSVVQTLSTQHCSDISSSDIGRFVCCMVIGPHLSQTLTPFHFFTGCGGIKRSTLAYGIPRKPIEPSWSIPFTKPDSVLTIILSCCCAMHAIVNSMAIVDNTIVRFISLLFVRKDTKFWEIKYKRIPFLCSYTQNFVSLHTK